MEGFDVDNIIQSIIESSDNTWTPLGKIPLVVKEIDKLKADLQIFVESSDYDIPSILKESNKLYKESNLLVANMTECKEEIEQETMAEILKSIECHKKIAEELESANFSINILYDVTQCGNFMKEFKDNQDHSFYRIIEGISDTLQYVTTPAEGFDQLDIYENIKTSANEYLETVLNTLYKNWDEMIKYTLKSGPKETVITMTLNVDEPDVLKALDFAKKLMEKVSEFAQFLMKEVLIPIMHHNASVIAETDEMVTITIRYKPNFRPTYHDVISNMRLLFHFMSNCLDLEFDHNKTIMKMMGSILSQDFCDTIVKECFIGTVPNNIIELQTYGRITSEIEDFQRFLMILKFFPRDGVSMLKYIENIDVLFAESSSQYFLETARTIMTKDLSVTMSIGVERIPEDLVPKNKAGEHPETTKALEIFDKTIPKSLFYFPRCMISKTAQELLDLVYSIMEQAVQCPDIVCKKLYFTVRYIFELYDAVVPYHHENYLQTIPQYVALFHNNCMYLAHNLQTLGDKWLSLMEGRNLDYAIGFVDLVPKLRDLGYKHLTLHMQQQRKQILDNIRSSDLNSIVVKDVLGANAEAAVRACLRQLQLLKNVWVGVFPANVFTRLMATLTSMFAEELVHRVVSAEDISAEMAAQLADMLALLLNKAPQLFQNTSDVDEFVKSWGKVRELIFVLRGSLKDIESRWHDGTGPLADHFSSDELRSLVKALFQISQLRSNLLSKLK